MELVSVLASFGLGFIAGIIVGVLIATGEDKS